MRLTNGDKLFISFMFATAATALGVLFLVILPMGFTGKPILPPPVVFLIYPVAFALIWIKERKIWEWLM